MGAEAKADLIGEGVGIILNSFEGDHAFYLWRPLLDLVGADGERYLVFSHTNPITILLRKSNLNDI